MERYSSTHRHWGARLARQAIIIVPLALLAVGVALRLIDRVLQRTEGAEGAREHCICRAPIDDRRKQRRVLRL